MITTRAAGTPHAQTTSTSLLVPLLALGTLVTMVHGMAIGPLMPAIAADLETSVALLGQISAA